jgi:1,4-alpha-glucan branching enzyme
LFNSDSVFYAGSNVNNGEGIAADDQPWMDQPYSMLIKLPPLAGVILSNSK